MTVGFGIIAEYPITKSPRVMMLSFENLAKGIKSLREPLELAIKGVLAPSFRQNFYVGGRPAWEPLSDVTIERKHAKGSKNPETILVDTGALRRMAGQLNIWTVEGGYGNIGAAEARLDNMTLPYAEIHQVGMTNMPARPWAVIQPEDEEKIQFVFDAWMARRAAAAGWR